MVAHRNRLRLLAALSAFMFFSSVQAMNNTATNSSPGGSTPFNYWEYILSFVYNAKQEGMGLDSKKLKTDNGNTEEKYFSVVGVAVKAATVLVVWKVGDTLIDESMPILIDYLPNAWPFTQLKEHNRLNRERKEIDRIIAQYEHEEKVAKFKERTGITDIRMLVKKSH